MQEDSISIRSVLGMLATLSADNKKWIADRLYEQVASDKVCELDEAIKAAHTGKLYHADNVAELMADLMK